MSQNQFIRVSEKIYDTLMTILLIELFLQIFAIVELLQQSWNVTKARFAGA
jgi:hypothetical protein